MSKIYLDVGLPKTATTFRQKILYPILDINYHTMENNKNYLDLLLFSDYSNGNHIISCEAFSGWSYLPDHDVISERKLAIASLSRLFPKAKIIISTREINTWKTSLYNQYVWSGGINNYSTWLDRMDKNVFDIGKYINLLKNNFSDVLVLPFELLKSNHQEFTKRLCQYLDVKVPSYENRALNASLSYKQLKLYRYLNHLWRTHENPVGLPFFKHWRELLYRITVKDDM